MHEVPLLLSVAEQIRDAIQDTDVNHVDQVLLEIGDCTGIVPEFMIDGYQYISDEYDFLRGSELIIDRIKGIGICEDCGQSFPIIENEGKCPSCGSMSKELVSGQEFIIKEIRVFEQETI